MRSEKVGLPINGKHFDGGLFLFKREVNFMFEVVGILGSLIVCISACPQIAKTWKTKKANDLSIYYLLSLMIGILMITIYSIRLADVIFIFANTLSILSTGILIVFWFYFGKKSGSKSTDRESS